GFEPCSGLRRRLPLQFRCCVGTVPGSRRSPGRTGKGYPGDGGHCVPPPSLRTFAARAAHPTVNGGGRHMPPPSSPVYGGVDRGARRRETEGVRLRRRLRRQGGVAAQVPVDIAVLAV